LQVNLPAEQWGYTDWTRVPAPMNDFQ